MSAVSPHTIQSHREDHQAKPLQPAEIRELCEELLPGIPNDITLEMIIPKTPWRTLQVMSSVSRVWQHAIESRQAYDAPVRSHSTEELCVLRDFLCCKHKIVGRLHIRSTRDIRPSPLYLLPKIPQLGGIGIPLYCEIVTMDGKIYILGGVKKRVKNRTGKVQYGSGRVFVLDLAGQNPWKECANMLQPRLFVNPKEDWFLSEAEARWMESGCQVEDGRIYVVGSRPNLTTVYPGIQYAGNECGCGVYDPTLDTWSPMYRTYNKVHTDRS